MGVSDFGSSDLFQYGYPLASAIISAAFPNRGRAAVSALNTGLGIANYYDQEHQKDEQNKILSQKLGDLFKTTTPVTTQQTVASQPFKPADTTDYTMPDANAPLPASAGSLAPVPLQTQTTTVQKPVFNPQQQALGEALTAAHNPGLALPILTRELMKEPQKPSSVRPGGALVDPSTGKVIYQAPAAETTPPRPVIGTQGGEGVTTIYNPVSKQWEISRTPLTAAPAHQLTPEEQALKNAQLRVENARIGLVGAQTQNARSESDLRQGRLKHLNDTIAKANDPKATAGQASAAMNALIRERDSTETPDEDKPVINDAIRAVRQRLAEIGKNPNGAQGAQPQAAPKPATDPNDPLGIRKKK